MRVQVFLFMLGLLGGYIPLHGQSVYQFSYRFSASPDNTTYYAFFVRFADGSGLMRVRYTQPGSSSPTVVETDMTEVAVADLDGKEDTSSLLFTPVNPRLITGEGRGLYTPPVFYFRYNQTSGYLEPAGVIRDVSSPLEMDPSTQFTAQWIDYGSLSRSLVGQYFSEDEDFYMNLFASNGRGLSPDEKKIRLFLIIVANINEPEIGASCQGDLARAQQTFNSIATYMGITVIPTVIAGNNYNKKAVQAAISGLHPGANDIVIFYYSGHGFRKPSDKRRFPYIDLRAKPQDDYLSQSLHLEDIFTAIKNKGARLNLVMSDCCNTPLEISNATGSKISPTKGSGVNLSMDNCRALFLSSTPMSLMATAADSSQRASSNNNFGGFFSYFFTSSLQGYCSVVKTSPTWDQLLEDTKTQTIAKAQHTYCDKPYIPQNICQQFPVYKIVFGK